MFAPMEPPPLDNIKYEHSPPSNTVPTYGSHHYYSPFSEWNQPQNYYGQGWPQQPNIHVNYIMNSNVIHNYGAATPTANTNTSAIQPGTNLQSVSIKNYITFGNTGIDIVMVDDHTKWPIKGEEIVKQTDSKLKFAK